MGNEVCALVVDRTFFDDSFLLPESAMDGWIAEAMCGGFVGAEAARHEKPQERGEEHAEEIPVADDVGQGADEEEQVLISSDGDEPDGHGDEGADQSDPLALAFGALDRQSTANESNDMASNYRVLRERGLAGQTMMEV